MSNANGGYTTGRRMALTRLRLSFWGSVHAELVKLMSLASTWWLIGIAILLMPAITALSVWGTIILSGLGDDDQTSTVAQSVASADLWSSIGSAFNMVGLVIGILGVMAITTEYTTSSVQASLSVNPRRVVFMNAKALATWVCVFVAMLIGMLVSWVVMFAMSAHTTIEPLSHDQRFVPLVVIVGGPAILACMAVLSLGLGAMCRSTVGGIFALIGVEMLLPSLFTIAPALNSHFIWMESIGACLPSTTMSVFLSGPGGGSGASRTATADLGQAASFAPDWWQGGLIFLAWAVVFYIIGVIVVARSDVK